MKSLDKILSTFNKTLRDLDVFVEEQDKKIEANEQVMAELQSDNFMRRRDVKRAEQVRQRIEALLSSDE